VWRHAPGDAASVRHNLHCRAPPLAQPVSMKSNIHRQFSSFHARIALFQGYAIPVIKGRQGNSPVLGKFFCACDEDQNHAHW
jgi:hypothetical protein